MPLTHPDLSELPRSQFALQLQGLAGDLPLVLPPGLLGSFGLGWLHQLGAQAIRVTWGRRVGVGDGDGEP